MSLFPCLRTVCVVLAAVLSIACGNGDPVAALIQNVPTRPSADVPRVPGTKVFEAVRAVPDVDPGIDHFMEVAGVVPLEVTEEAIVGEVTSLVWLDGHWYLTDKLQQKVFCFRQDGRFVRAFGGLGQGPGEFQSVRTIRVAFDDHLAIADLQLGAIHLFRPDGTFVRRVQPHIDGKVFLSRIQFEWPREDLLIMARFASADPVAPLHVALDPDASSPRVLFGFGRRNPAASEALARGVGLKAFTAFARVGDTIWSGSPYETVVSVFDLDGYFHADLGTDIARNPETMLQAEDVEGLADVTDPRGETVRNLVQKGANHMILPVDDRVLVWLGEAFDLYDRAGNLIHGNLKTHRMIPVGTGDGLLVTRVPPGLTIDEAVRHYGGEAIRNHLETHEYPGYDNPFLVLYRFREETFTQTRESLDLN